MATGATQPSPAELEQTYLAALEQFCRTSGAYQAQSADQQFQYALQCEAYVHTYDPMAQYLMSVGLPRLSERVKALLDDYQRAKAIYAQIFQARIATDREIGQILAQSQRDILKMQLEANQRQQKAYDEANARWLSNF